VNVVNSVAAGTLEVSFITSENCDRRQAAAAAGERASHLHSGHSIKRNHRQLHLHTA
jgi:hypothetical protein